jgi:hypothetical protein
VYPTALAEEMCTAGAGCIIAEFLRVPSGVAAEIGRHYDLGPFTETDGSTRHLPLHEKLAILEGLKAVTDRHSAELTVKTATQMSDTPTTQPAAATAAATQPIDPQLQQAVATVAGWIVLGPERFLSSLTTAPAAQPTTSEIGPQ